ncbi:hypothetical protein HNR44_002886 [Geomicrobium halophilum]|uniref:Transglutaminase-like domain-containing protein n=1 Tax=Geomicrobium halophilum TaxID=549000 RepID=A0A841PUT2_9BACL|nr:transglutaminase domain-containing protein [Geomicrobium halophilum]MBB6450896.1 hypothetical protein [Geomicrobium halophilum]
MFLVVTAVFFLIQAIPMPLIVRFLLFVVTITYSLNVIFMPGTYVSIDWWSLFVTELWQETGLLFSGEWLQLGDLYRSFLMLLLLSMVSYLMFYWIVYAKRIFFFFVLTVIYIGALDAFTSFDGIGAIIRVVAIGFLLFSILHMSRFTFRYPNVRLRQWGRFLFVAVSVMTLSIAIGWQAPKYSQQWPDPLPVIEEAAGFGPEGWGSSGDDVRRIGYGDHDEQLGGGFEMDETEVFTARAETSGYWRGESKHEYTGHGWESVESDETSERVFLYEDETRTRTSEAHVSFNEQFSGDLLFSQGALQAVAAENGEPYMLQVEGATGRSYANGEEGIARPDEVTLTYETAEFPVEIMQEADHPDYDREDPSDYHSYLQLPDDLPERVGQLAEEIVEDEENRYDRVRAIERFLTGPDFDYDTHDIPVPDEGEDYVDQFLFETQIGYCDNFSTSMAVMLRTLDIPTRWVKGFTPGEAGEVDENGYTEYEVTNSNAHSWVEVYFSDVGWVPFEPTPGFSNAAEYEMADFDEGEASEDPEFDQEFQQDMEDQVPDEEESEEVSASASEDDDDPSSFSFWWLGILGGVGLIFASVMAYRLRGKMITTWMRRRYQGMHDTSTYVRAYESLIWYLNWIGLKKAGNETPTEFAKRVDARFNTDEMRTLTNLYEDLYYGNHQLEHVPEGTQRRWLKLLDKISRNH